MQDRLPQPDLPLLEQIRVIHLAPPLPAHHPPDHPTMFAQQALHTHAAACLGTPKARYPLGWTIRYNPAERDIRHNGTSFQKWNVDILIILIEGVVVYSLPQKLELASPIS
jgi:hypothetical protein